MQTKILFILAIFASQPAFAADSTPSKEVSPDGEQVDVSKVTEKYWAQGKDTELGVVQNRKYTSEHRFEFDLFTGTVSTDPFLSVHNYGVSLGYYFNQYMSAHITGWKSSVSDSAAYTSFNNAFAPGTPKAALYLNRPTSFYGAELNENLLYGKASFFGNAIIYVDIFALAGGGVTNTDNGKNFTYFGGLGQKIHLNKYMSLNLDYRIMFFN
jgi:outer membrane beta-barrel protein